jgi:4-hydroxythreonine-4-phosphate dehydrogenase
MVIDQEIALSSSSPRDEPKGSQHPNEIETMRQRPIVAITMGDPAGVGPEITAKALARDEVWDCCRPLVVGDVGILKKAVALVATPLTLHPIVGVAEAHFEPCAPDVLDLQNVDPAALQLGQISASAGQVSVDYVKRAVELALAGQVDAITTGPINKAALQAAGISYVGHTELLAALTDAQQVTTALALPGLMVVHVTLHVPLREVAAHITREHVLETIRLADAGLRRTGSSHPRVAVAALNPHAGDEGLLGREEIEVIGPAIKAAQAGGVDAQGPIPADSLFFRANQGEFDAVVVMYHDQGHIPVKIHGLERGVAVTLGLPIVRTSVDHGTAFDIAWQGLANEGSMVEAIRFAARLSNPPHRPL